MIASVDTVPAGLNPETLARWSAPRRVRTKFGERMLRKAAPTPEFSEAWKTQKDTLKALGLTWAKESDGSWSLCWWQQLPREMVEHEKKMVEASRATDAAVDVPRPEGLDYMPFQRAGIAAALRILGDWPEGGQGAIGSARQRGNGMSKGALIADQPGLGKTIQAIGIINAIPEIRRVLVFAPATLKVNWYRELKKWLVRPISVGIGYSKCVPPTEILILNYDLAAKLRRRLESVEWDLIVCDEVHLLRNPDSQRTKAIFGHEPSRKEIAAGADPVPPLPTQRRLGLTGTPLVNKPAELWPIIHWTDPDAWQSKWKFLNRYCGAKNNGWGTTFDGATNLGELQERLRSTCMIRRLKSDVLVDLPPKTRQIIELPANGAAEVIARERQVNDKWDAAIADLRARVELAKATADDAQYAESVKALGEAVRVAFDECTKAAHEVALAKVPYVIEHVREAADDGKIVLFAHHLDCIQQYVDAFRDMGALKITGEVSLEERQRAVDAFQGDASKRIIVCGIMAAGVGLTLTASSHVIFAELDWVPANMLQCEDRCHRISQKNNVLVQHMVLEGSVDVRKAQALVRKMDIADQALDRKPVERQYPVYEAPKDDLEAKAERFGGDAVRVKKEAYEKEAATITKEQTEAIVQGLQMLAGVCDGAAKLDGIGFSKVDAAIGHSLAVQGWLSPKQAVLGRRICRKYKRQLPVSLIDAIGGQNDA